MKTLLVACVVLLLVHNAAGFMTKRRTATRFSSYNTLKTIQKVEGINDLPPPPPYKTYYYDQVLDHFNYFVTKQTGEASTYKQRYLIADGYWGKPIGGKDPFPKHKRKAGKEDCPGPILFYTGNESPVTDYYKASGFFTQVLAPKFGALMIFAEHRYFGESMPFGDKSFEGSNIAYDSSDQALADYARLLRYLKATIPKASECPIFSYGGSYGGMLTTWFRMKYSNVVMGGLAASAPFPFYGTGIAPQLFDETASQTFEDAKTGCGQTLEKALDTMKSLVDSSTGRAHIRDAFQLCDTKPLTQQGAEEVFEWVVAGLEDMCMLDYPYPTDYGIPIQGWPVNNTCEIVMAEYNSDPIRALAHGVGTFYNGTGQHSCFNISVDVPDWGTCCGWNYLACTDVYIPSANGGIFGKSVYNLTADEVACKQEFGTQLQPYWPITHWGGYDLSAASNIIFSNGMLDPWHTSGVLHNISDSLIAILIPEAAHHLDLRQPNPADPIYVREARIEEEELIYKWLSEYLNDEKYQ